MFIFKLKDPNLDLNLEIEHDSDIKINLFNSCVYARNYFLKYSIITTLLRVWLLYYGYLSIKLVLPDSIILFHEYNYFIETKEKRMCSWKHIKKIHVKLGVAVPLWQSKLSWLH